MRAPSFMNILGSKRGTTSLIFICSTILVILLSALFTDIGYIAYQRYKLRYDVDTIAKLGAEALCISREECIKVIESNVVKRIKGVNKLDVRISDNNREITIYTGRKLQYVFLRFFGLKDKQLESNVTAKISIVTSYKGIRPFAVEKKEIIYGEEYILSPLDPLSNKIGNDKAMGIVLLDQGKGSFETNMLYGYIKSVNIGDHIYAIKEDSAKVSTNLVEKIIQRCNHQPICTYDNHKEDCPRILVIPVVDKIDPSGKKAMTVLGFTAFFIEGIDEKLNAVNGNTALKGRFMIYTVNSDTSDEIYDFGLLGVKLIH
ncbi:MAG: hypothetical protein GX660_27550 [Clostridiaceae bacterium]|nr:hypothetical protein [Clostridiaceae bacterium]